MKKGLLILAAAAGMVFSMASASRTTTQDNAECILSSKEAIRMARQACGNVPPSGGSYQAVLDYSGTCEGGGCYAQYTVGVFYTCEPVISCTPAPPVYLALVNQNCDGTIEIQCLN